MEGNDKKLSTTEPSQQGDIPSLSVRLELVTTQAMAHPSVSQSPGPPVTGMVMTPEVHVSTQTGSAEGGTEQGGFGDIAKQTPGSLKGSETSAKVHDHRGARPKEYSTAHQLPELPDKHAEVLIPESSEHSEGMVKVITGKYIKYDNWQLVLSRREIYEAEVNFTKAQSLTNSPKL